MVAGKWHRNVPFVKNVVPDDGSYRSQSGEPVAGDLGVEQQKGAAAERKVAADRDDTSTR